MEAINKTLADELVERINKSYKSLENDYKYYKNIVLEQVQNNNLTDKVQAKYEYAQKVLNTYKFYFKDVLESEEEVF